MKHLINSMMVLLLLLCGQILPVYGVNADSIIIEVDEEPKRELPNRGQRMPSLSLICHISKADGVTICNEARADIISFEIYDSNDICIGVFSEEKDFMEIFFSDLTLNIHKVIFETEYARYIGYVR